MKSLTLFCYIDKSIFFLNYLFDFFYQYLLVANELFSFIGCLSIKYQIKAILPNTDAQKIHVCQNRMFYI